MMSVAFNPLEHPVCLDHPERLAPSHWTEHTPFAMWLISALRPRLLVELGTFRGTSYAAFCQAIQKLGLATKAYAVDTWEGDPHNGANDEEVFTELSSYHDARYSSFSRLLRMNFDQAVSQFEDGSIDLLHIDGYHTYEAVRHDFETWLPKVSDRGVVLLHDCVERILDFGVYRYWEELEQRFPSFKFQHEHGLGLVLVGPNHLPELKALTELSPERVDSVRGFFHELGSRVRLGMELSESQTRLADECARSLQLAGFVQSLEQRVSEVAAGGHRAATMLRDVLAREAELENRHTQLQENEKKLLENEKVLQQQLRSQKRALEDIQASSAWRLAHRFANACQRLAPPGSKRRDLITRWLVPGKNPGDVGRAAQSAG